ncbi:hypothetical protein GCM10023259_027910 [Thermocatellispora tengchongensis]
MSGQWWILPNTDTPVCPLREEVAGGYGVAAGSGTYPTRLGKEDADTPGRCGEGPGLVLGHGREALAGTRRVASMSRAVMSRRCRVIGVSGAVGGRVRARAV